MAGRLTAHRSPRHCERSWLPRPPGWLGLAWPPRPSGHLVQAWQPRLMLNPAAGAPMLIGPELPSSSVRMAAQQSSPETSRGPGCGGWAGGSGRAAGGDSSDASVDRRRLDADVLGQGRKDFRPCWPTLSGSRVFAKGSTALLSHSSIRRTPSATRGYKSAGPGAGVPDQLTDDELDGLHCRRRHRQPCASSTAARRSAAIWRAAAMREPSSSSSSASATPPAAKALPPDPRRLPQIGAPYSPASVLPPARPFRHTVMRDHFHGLQLPQRPGGRLPPRRHGRRLAAPGSPGPVGAKSRRHRRPVKRSSPATPPSPRRSSPHRHMRPSHGPVPAV